VTLPLAPEAEPTAFQQAHSGTNSNGASSACDDGSDGGNDKVGDSDGVGGSGNDSDGDGAEIDDENEVEDKEGEDTEEDDGDAGDNPHLLPEACPTGHTNVCPLFGVLESETEYFIVQPFRRFHLQHVLM
jgi:hypothetical protein